MSLHYRKLQDEISKLGIFARGGFCPSEEDEVPKLNSGDLPRSVLMIGNVGSGEFWRRFKQSTEYQSGIDNPMDRWTKRIVGEFADRYQGTALFPSDGPPYYPFQRWASRAEALFPSPIGLYISDKWGTWHALRAAILLPKAIEDLPLIEDTENPCLSCVEQPCLSACPVTAFNPGQFYDYLGCARHVSSVEGQDCAQNGCLSRRVCPQGQNFILLPEHAAFHMTAFIKARKNAGEL